MEQTYLSNESLRNERSDEFSIRYPHEIRTPESSRLGAQRRTVNCGFHSSAARSQQSVGPHGRPVSRDPSLLLVLLVHLVSLNTKLEPSSRIMRLSATVGIQWGLG